jgi:hypothetical protein
VPTIKWRQTKFQHILSILKNKYIHNTIMVLNFLNVTNSTESYTENRLKGKVHPTTGHERPGVEL